MRIDGPLHVNFQSISQYHFTNIFFHMQINTFHIWWIQIAMINNDIY